MSAWRWADTDVVRARIASLVMPGVRDDARLGDVLLREHQVDAANRLRVAIDRFGGALLADEVGLGKTYTALATARDAAALLIVAPAALASMWRFALERSKVSADFVSFETLSRRSAPSAAYDTVIVDEAHHARNAATRRYDRLASVTRLARVLLISATPVHNAKSDLHALLSLFLGSRAERMTPDELTACIVRRTRSDVRDTTIPGRADPVWCNVDGSAAVLDAILELPSPCPPRDGGDGGALVTLSLVRAWASSEAALRAALRRRIARAESLGDALSSGRYPSRSELRAWVVGDDATQLAFPELIADPVADDLRAFIDAVRRHVGGARRALAIISENSGAIDDQRSAIIRGIRRRHAGERIVVFSQFADTVREMFSRLRADGGVASVTATGALVAGGPLTRTQVLERFAPLASGVRPPSRAETVEVLIATDLLSEGLNLQDASVVVHVDLPWTAARLTQRLGRVWRIGSQYSRVHEYALAPPAQAEQVLRVIRILSHKAGTAWAAVGEPFAPLLTARSKPEPLSGPPNAVDAAEEIHVVLRRWARDMNDVDGRLSPTEDSSAPARVMVAGVRAAVDGWIAAVEEHDRVRLVVSRGGAEPTSDPRAVLEAMRVADAVPCVTAPSRVTRVMQEIDAHLDAVRAAADAGVGAVGSRTRAHAASRIAALAAAAPPHRRVAVSRLAADARQAVAASRSAGAERLLAAMVSQRSNDDTDKAAEVWLQRVIDASEFSSPNVHGVDRDASSARLLALIVLVPSGNRDQ